MGAEVSADIPGMILKVNVKEGDHVKMGDALFVLEAMKMELEIPSPSNGTVSAVHVGVNDVVQPGQPLATLE
ncbi:MAG: biotin/lipoyl-containing protein [Thermoplasmata archaeon]